MEPSSRDRISVDLHGLKAPLMERAQAVGLSPSHLVRQVLADALGRPAPLSVEACRMPSHADQAPRTRLSLRMRSEDAAATLQAADTGPAPKLIRIETDAGHGAGKPTDKLIAERADILAFIAHRFGMTPP